MSKIHIVRASAGSGKTYKLTEFFLLLLIPKHPEYFKRLLAVTFTNKATEEMKSRIIERLHELATGQYSHHLARLKEETQMNEGQIRNKAKVILQHILHDYSWFSIETIDSFFQRIIRSFTREMGMPGNYRIETDITPILEYAVDNMLDNISPDSDILQWLVRFSEDKIAEGRSWDIKYDLLKLGGEVFREEYADNSVVLAERVADKSALERFRKNLAEVIVRYENAMKAMGAKALQLFRENGITSDDLFQKNRGVIGFFTKLSKGDFSEPNSYVIKMLEGEEFWPAKSSSLKAEIEALARNTLLPLLREIFDLMQEHGQDYQTAREILRNIYTVGILSDLYKYIIQYRHEQNTFILSDASVFINKIIDHNDAPFIYEKMGNRYHHFLIDEFQDTSTLQWKNFHPLIANSLAGGHKCLVVGDAKQSIYRWRNSDWEILASKIEKQFFDEEIEKEMLENNWRSAGNIVQYNNEVFTESSRMLSLHLISSLKDMPVPEEVIEQLTYTVYGDVTQLSPEFKKDRGKVEVQFFSKVELNDSPEIKEDFLINKINEHLEKGFAPGEIAILVRGKKEGSELADLLIGRNSAGHFVKPVGVISNESLFIEASDSVNLLISALRYLYDPGDDINRGKLVHQYRLIRNPERTSDGNIDLFFETGSTKGEQFSEALPAGLTAPDNRLLALPLYDLVEELNRIFELGTDRTEVPYTDAFLDLIHEFTQSESAAIEDFLVYWDEKGKTRSIAATESQNAVRILTIHKSKGLEFPVVFIPGCDWGLNQKQGAILWANAQKAGFDYLPILPVNYGTNLKKSHFAADYALEFFRSHIDNLNLMYVAFTRASESLVVMSSLSKSGESGEKINDVGALLYQTLAKGSSSTLTDFYHAEENAYLLGELESRKGSDSPRQEIVMHSVTGKPVTDRLFFNPTGYDLFFEQRNSSREQALRGIVFHNILSRVVEAKDISRVTADAVFEGWLNEEESKELVVHFKEGNRDSRVKSWFDGSGKCMNEAAILLNSGETKRPDRVVIFPDELHVIDYKFGAEDARKHGAQLKEYIKLIEEMGYQNISGFIWYLNTNRIVDV